MMPAIIVCVGYLLGSAPVGFLIVRLSSGLDIRTVGSGNVGATNVLRQAGWRPAMWTATLDVAKGVAAVLVGQALGAAPTVCAAAGVAAIVGHMFPVWLRFAGGKGVATTFGVCLVLAPSAALLALTLFACTVGFTRYVSVGSLVAAFSIGPLCQALGSSRAVVIAAVIAGCLVWYRHRGNLVRLWSGAEPPLVLRRREHR